MKVLVMILMLTVLGAGGATAQEVKREITRVTFDTYRFQNKYHANIFVITGDGVVVTDPINDEVAVSYQAAIAELTDKPVLFVVYSHYHWDRVSGAALFVREGAKVVAQEKCAQRFAENPNPAVVSPDLTFTDRYTVDIDNRSLELYYFGPSHGDCLTVFVAQPAGVMQIVDVVNPPGAAFPPDPLVPYIRPHNIQQFFTATGDLIDQSPNAGLPSCSFMLKSVG